MANTFVDSDGLVAIATKMKHKADNIKNTYTSNTKPAIIASNECLVVSGLDSTTIVTSLTSIFENLTERIDSLSKFLVEKVAAEYNVTTQAIVAEFNGEFADELSKLLGITVKPATPSGSSGSRGGSSFSSSSNSGSDSDTPTPKPKYEDAATDVDVARAEQREIRKINEAAANPPKYANAATDVDVAKAEQLAMRKR